jgi:hypothetical protein
MNEIILHMVVGTQLLAALGLLMIVVTMLIKALEELK